MTFNYENFANATEDVIQTPSFLAKSMSVKVPKEKNLINEEEEQKGGLRQTHGFVKAGTESIEKILEIGAGQSSTTRTILS